jgi:superkiller protein 3
MLSPYFSRDFCLQQKAFFDKPRISCLDLLRNKKTSIAFYPVYLFLGLVFFLSVQAMAEETKTNKTIEHYDALLAEDSNNASLYYERGLLYLQQKAWIEARVDFRKFVELRPSIAEGYNNLAITYFQCGEYLKANACWEAALQRNRQSPLYFKNNILVLEKLGNFDQALSLLNQRLLDFPQDAENYLLRAHFLGLLGQTQEQVRDLSKYLQTYPNKHSIRAKRALLFEKLGKKEQAQDDLRILVPILSSVDVSLQSPLIFLADRLQHYEAVLSLLRVALFTHPDDLNLVQLGVKAALALNRKDLALSYLSKGWDTTREETLLLQSAELHLEMGTPDLALKNMDLYRQHAGPDLRHALLRIRITLRMEQWEKALEATKTALDLDPKHFEVLQKQAFILGRLERFDEALDIFEKIVKQKPEDVASRYNRGNCFLALGQKTEALEDFSKTLLLDPTHLEARFNRAHLYFEKKLWKEAVSDFHVLLEKEPGNAEYWLKIARAEFHQSLLPESEEHYTKAKTLNPALPDYEYYFAEGIKGA